jgi:small-conductance mechanosensitive channel
MTPVTANVVDRAGEALGNGLPRIGAALVLLVVGLILARVIGWLLVRGLRAAGLDDLAERAGIHDAIASAGLGRSFSRLVGGAIRIALSVVVIFAALSLTGLAFLSQSLNEGVLFIPRVFAAALLVLAGVVVGGLARDRADRLAYQMDLPGPVGRGTQIAIIAVFAVTALAQVGVSTSLLTLLLTIALGGTVLAFALAFGLGNREVARAVGAGRYVRGAFTVGQSITVGAHSGEIAAIEAAATVLRTPAGTLVRIPNHVLLEDVVEVRGGGGERPPPG